MVATSLQRTHQPPGLIFGAAEEAEGHDWHCDGRLLVRSTDGHTCGPDGD